MTQEVNNENSSALSIEEANQLVLENQGWAESIAKSVARAWNMDWKLDGLDGAALEALIFCSRRFDPAQGVPFRGYARKRIHEASSEAAKKTRGWRRGLGTASDQDRKARQISSELIGIFPELRSGEIPFSEEDDRGGGQSSEGALRGSIRQLLLGATLVAVKQGLEHVQPDDLLEYKKVIESLAELEPIHQQLLWKVYWEGVSLRGIAAEWETDGLNVIREHKTLIEYLQKSISKGKQFLNKPKVRPGLKNHALVMKKEDNLGAFARFKKELYK